VTGQAQYRGDTEEGGTPAEEEAERDAAKRAVKKLQEKLGDANDVRMSRDLLAELARTGTDGAAVARAGRAVIDWHRRRLKRAEGKTEKQLAKFRKKVSSW